MEQNSIKNLQSQLYIEDLRLQYEKKNFWFTKQAQFEWEKDCKTIIANSKKPSNAEYGRDFFMEGIHDIREEYHHLDFVLGLMYSYCLSKYANDKNVVEINIPSMLLHTMPLDLGKLTDENVAALYDRIDRHIIHKQVSIDSEIIELDYIVKDFAALGKASNVLEIGTSFFNKSDKIVKDNYAYTTYKCMNLLTQMSGSVNIYDESKLDSLQSKYDIIITSDELCGDLDVFQKIEKVLNQKRGKLIVFSPYGRINSSEFKKFRKWIVDNDLLKLYVCDATNNRKLGFLLPTWSVISSEDFTGKDIHFIANRDFAYYGGILNSHKKLTKKQLQNLDYDFDKFSEFDEKCESGKVVNFNQIFQVEQELVDCKDIEGYVFNCVKQPINIFSFRGSCDSLKIRKMMWKMYKVCKPAIVASMKRNGEWIFSEILPSEEKPIFVYPTDIVLYCNEQLVLPEYVYLMQRNGLFQRMVRSKHIYPELLNSVSPIIGEDICEDIYPKDNLGVFNEYTFTVPNIEEQNSAIKNIEIMQEASMHEIDSLERLIEKKREEYIGEVRLRKHDMMPCLMQINSARELMVYDLENFEAKGKDASLQDMMKRLNHQNDALQRLSYYMDHLTMETKFGKPENLNICTYLTDKTFVGNTDGINYTIDSYIDYESLKKSCLTIPNNHSSDSKECDVDAFVYIAKEDLFRICDNIVQNAVHHGFTDANRTDYWIKIALSVNAERDMFQIDFINNGNPFPKGMDKKNYGDRYVKAGSHAGYGEGGYIIKTIVEHYEGDYDILRETNDGVEINIVRILLPIMR